MLVGIKGSLEHRLFLQNRNPVLLTRSCYTVKMLGLLQPYFGHLCCMPVVYVTHYTIQTSKDASNLVQSVVEKLLYFVRLEIRIFLQKAINQHLW